MREIKFRGYNGTKWLYSTEISGVPCFDEVYYFMPNKDNELTQEYIGNWDSVSYVGEYTGLKDINGIEIYEGDIVERRFMNLIDGAEFVGVVKYYDGAFNVDNNREAYPLFHEIDETEILGNIYENPKLLEGINND